MLMISYTTNTYYYSTCCQKPLIISSLQTAKSIKRVLGNPPIYARVLIVSFTKKRKKDNDFSRVPFVNRLSCGKYDERLKSAILFCVISDGIKYCNNKHKIFNQCYL